MDSKERVMVTLACDKADRVPINYSANAGINGHLKQHFGIEPNDNESLLELFGVDFRGVKAPYVGPRLHEDIPKLGIKTDMWGIRRIWVEHESGGYWDYCDFPLRDANEETVANWPMPSPDDFDYSGVAEYCRKRQAYAIYVGGAGLACVINTAGFFRGMEQVFIDLALDDPVGMSLINRFLDIQFEVTRRTLEAARGGIDFMRLGEDLGSQNAPLIDMKIFKKHILSRQKRFFDLAKAYNLPTMLHTCGSSSWAYEEYIKLGLSAVDTLQPEALNMDPVYLKKNFGGRLAFHGCISTGGPVAYGSVDEAINYCRNTLDIMMPNGGYCFAPTHALQDNSPVANVLAMYETAHKYGKY